MAYTQSQLDYLNQLQSLSKKTGMDITSMVTSSNAQEPGSGWDYAKFSAGWKNLDSATKKELVDALIPIEPDKRAVLYDLYAQGSFVKDHNTPYYQQLGSPEAQKIIAQGKSDFINKPPSQMALNVRANPDKWITKTDGVFNPDYLAWSGPAYSIKSPLKLKDPGPPPGDALLGTVAGIIGTALGGPMVGGALGGFVGGASNATNENPFIAGLKGAAKGGITGEVSSMIPGIDTGNPLLSNIATGAERGAASSALNKGNIGTGALSGALSGGIGTALGTAGVPSWLQPTATGLVKGAIMPTTGTKAPTRAAAPMSSSFPSLDKLTAYLSKQKGMAKPSGAGTMPTLDRLTAYLAKQKGATGG